MNKLTRLVALLFLTITVGVKAQEGTGTPASQYPLLQNKLEKSEKDINNPKKSGNPKFWLSRADLMMDIFDVNLQHLGKGAQATNMRLMFGEPKEKKAQTKDGKSYEIHVHENVTITYLDGVVDSYEETNKLHSDPLPVALEALMSAEELDSDKKLTKKIKVGYDRLKPLFERRGLEAYIKEDYKSAFNSFKSAVDMNLMDINSSVIDTVMIFNAGMTASKAGMDQESIKYYELARTYNYDEPSLYIYLKNKYFTVSDTIKGVEVLRDGFEKFPGSNEIVIELINYYLINDQADEALEYIRIGQEKDPSNVSLVFAEGTLYDKKGEFEKAIEVYKKCTEIQPEFFNGYYNLGVVYYNMAQKVYDNASNIRDDNEYKAEMKKGDETLVKAIAPMEKCHELNPAEVNVLEVLKSIYYRLKMDDKYADVQRKLGEK